MDSLWFQVEFLQELYRIPVLVECIHYSMLKSNPWDIFSNITWDAPPLSLLLFDTLGDIEAKHHDYGIQLTISHLIELLWDFTWPSAS